jgi:tetratricopeptide (TPR) repeat protein
MHNHQFSKLIYFLATLDGEGKALFRAYLHSPVFNQKTEACGLYDFILEHCLLGVPREIDDGAAVLAVWPEGNGDAAKLKKLKTALMNLLLAFFEFQHWRESPAWARLGMMHRMQATGDETYFDHYYGKVGQELLDLPQQDIATYAAKLDLELVMMRHRQAQGFRSNDSHIDIAAKAMERLVQGQVLKFAFLFANQGRIVGGDMPHWIQYFLAKLQYADVEGEPLLEIYFLLLATMDAQTELKQLLALKEKLHAQASRSPWHEAHSLYSGTLNNFAQFSRRSGHNMLEPIFELHQSMVEMLYGSGKHRIDRSNFKNIVHVGARLGQFDWVANFIERAGDWLDDAVADIALAYNRGILYFYQKQFGKATKEFHHSLADVKDVFYAYDARLYLLMCYYETGDSLGMESLVHSFRMLLGRSGKLSDPHKDKYKALVRLFRKLLGIPPNDQFRLSKLKAEIEGLPMSSGKTWLLEKIAELHK